jgi:ArsR family transcriptional regulator
MHEEAMTGEADLREGTVFHPHEVAAARAMLATDAAYVDLAELFGALADATRARLVHVLLATELCTGDLAAVLGISESGASQHLRILRALRLVKVRRSGKFVYYSLDDEHIALLVKIGMLHLGHGSGPESADELAPTAALENA